MTDGMYVDEDTASSAPPSYVGSLEKESQE
jgi:hypothetical protein